MGWREAGRFLKKPTVIVDIVLGASDWVNWDRPVLYLISLETRSK